MPIPIILETVTPVHVGSGESYGFPEAFIDGSGNSRELVRIDFPLVVSSFSRDDLDEFMTAWDQHDKDRLVGLIKKTIGGTAGVNAGKQAVRYRLPIKCPTTPTLVGPGRPDLVRCHARTGKDEIYIPGSTVKGAIRTALLHAYLEKDLRHNKVIFNKIIKYLTAKLRNIHKGSDFRKWRNMVGNKIDRFVFTTADVDEIQYKEPNPQQDLLKFIEVSDFHLVKGTGGGNEGGMKGDAWVDNLKTYSLSGDKFNPKNFNVFLEVATGTFSGTIGLSPQLVGIYKNWSGKGGTKKTGGTNQAWSSKYPKLHEKIRILGIDGNELEDPAKAEEKMVNHVLDACKEFTASLKERDDIEFSLEHPDDANARLGFGIGTLYQGIMDWLQVNAIDVALDLVIKIPKPKRIYYQIRTDQSTNTTYLDPPYPKSYELLESSGEPVGWVRLRKS